MMAGLGLLSAAHLPGICNKLFQDLVALKVITESTMVRVMQDDKQIREYVPYQRAVVRSHQQSSHKVQGYLKFGFATPEQTETTLEYLSNLHQVFQQKLRSAP